VAFSLVGFGGVISAVVDPGDVSYWVAGLAMVPVLYVAVIEFEDPWRAARVGVKRAVWAAAVTLAMAGAVLAAVSPAHGMWTVGGLMTLPLLVLLSPFLATQDTPGGEGANGPWGPPPAS
jgi:hypothetical protein